MADPGRPGQRPRRPAPEAGRVRTVEGPRVIKASRAVRPPAPPPPPRRREPVDRARVIFAIVGLLVIASLVLGSVLYGLDLSRPPETEADLRQQQAGLVPTLEAQLRENPGDVQKINVLANTLQNNGDYPGAIRWYERSIELRPDDPETRFAFGQALAAYGQRTDAEVQYRRAIDLAPQSARNHYYLGQLYLRWDPPRLEEARQQYTRASEMEPEGAWGRAARQQLDRLNATPTP